MKTVGDLVTLVGQGKSVVVEFRKDIQSKDDCYPEPGMRARITRASLPDEHAVLKIYFNFEEFAAHNLPFEAMNYYDKNGDATLTARQAGVYEEEDHIYFDVDEVLDELMVVQHEAGVKLYEAFKAEQMNGSYVQWLEQKLLAATAPKSMQQAA